MGENKSRIKQNKLNHIVFYKVKNNTVAARDGGERRKENTKCGKREKGVRQWLLVTEVVWTIDHWRREDQRSGMPIILIFIFTYKVTMLRKVDFEPQTKIIENTGLGVPCELVNNGNSRQFGMEFRALERMGKE